MKLLIIEDEIAIAESIKKGLEQEAMVVDMIHDGLEGLDYAQENEYDVILLDIMLPSLNGLEVLQKLRESKNDTPVILLTARGEVEDRVKGLTLGADDYISKPFSFEELVARIKAIARRPKQTVSELLHLGPLTIDIMNKTASLKGKTLVLSKKEYAMLEYMAKNTGRVISKQEMLDKLWDFDSDVLENTVEVYIGYLRNKIDKKLNKNEKLIHTVRGFGYILELK